MNEWKLLQNKYYDYLLNFDWICDRSSATPLYKQFAEQMKQKMIACNIPRRVKFPSVSTLANRHKVPRSVIYKGFALLAAEGYVNTKLHKSVHVSYPLDDTHRTHNWIYFIKRSRALIKNDAIINAMEQLDKQITRPSIPFINDEFGFGKFYRGLLARSAEQFDNNYPGNITKGSLRLREKLSELLEDNGVNTAPDNIVIMDSTRMTLHFISKILTKSTYLIPQSSRLTIRIQAELGHLPVRYIKCDARGPIVSSLYTSIKLSENPVLLTESGCVWPFGIPVDEERKREIREMCNAKSVPMIEYDLTHEHNFTGGNKPFTQAGHTGSLYFSSFMHTFMPENHITFATGPVNAINSLTAHHNSSFTSSLLNQFALLEALSTGSYAEFLTNFNHRLGRRHVAARALLSEKLSGLATWSEPVKDIYLVVNFRQDINVDALKPDSHFCQWMPGRLWGGILDNSIILAVTSCTLEQLNIFITQLAEQAGTQI